MRWCRAAGIPDLPVQFFYFALQTDFEIIGPAARLVGFDFTPFNGYQSGSTVRFSLNLANRSTQWRDYHTCSGNNFQAS
jgi:hypothetical protein